jgi:Domain of unknown function (DUF4397)
MTSVPISRRSALLATATSPFWLSACGGGGSDSGDGGSGGDTFVRAINLTTDLPSADLYIGDVKQFSALNTDVMANNIMLVANTYSVNVKSAGDTTALFTGSYSLSRDQKATAVIWGRKSSLRVSTLGEAFDTANLTAPNCQIRIFNATVDGGAVDVYITVLPVDPRDPPTVTRGGLVSGALAGFTDFAAGTYSVLVTGQGDPYDVRLSIPAITVTEKQFYTLVLTQAGVGGVLLNGTLIAQQAASVSAKSNKARVRLVASVAGGALVTASLGGTTAFSDFRSPTARGSGGYVLVDAGDTAVSATANGTAFGVGTKTFAVGQDYTLLAWGPANDPRLDLLADDNRPPSTAAFAKIRLVNGLSGSGLASILLNSSVTPNQTSDVAGGEASAYANLTASGISTLQATSNQQSDPLFTLSSTNNISLLVAQGVYTLFLLDGATDPTGRLTKDR